MAQTEEQMLTDKLALIERQANTIFTPTDKHPSNAFKTFLFYFMNNHNQSSYKAEQARATTTSPQKAVQQRNRNDEIFLNGPKYHYENIMMKDYLDYLAQEDKKNGTDFFKMHCENNSVSAQDPPVLNSKEEFLNYIINISDYAISRDYTSDSDQRVGERGVINSFKSKCLLWCDAYYKELYSKGALSSSQKLTIILCHLILRITAFIKANEQIIRILNNQVGFLEFDVGTPKTKEFSLEHLITARGSVRMTDSVKFALMNNNSSDQKTYSELDAPKKIEVLGGLFFWVISDLLLTDHYKDFTRKQFLCFIDSNNSTLGEPFWRLKETIEGLIMKAINHISIMVENDELPKHKREGLLEFQKTLINHKGFYTKLRPSFTELYRITVPQDFIRASELDNQLSKLNEIQSNIKLLKAHFDATDTDKQIVEREKNKLLEFENRLLDTITFIKRNRDYYNQPSVFNPDHFKYPLKYLPPKMRKVNSRYYVLLLILMEKLYHVISQDQEFLIKNSI